MVMYRSRGRRWLGAAIAAALVASLAAVLLKPMLERAIHERLTRQEIDGRTGELCKLLRAVVAPEPS